MVQPIQKRSVPMCIILTLITCNIYYLYWYYCIARDFYGANTPSRVDTSPGVVILLNIVTCGVYGLYMFYKWGKQMPEIFAVYGLGGGEDRSVLHLLLALLVGIGPLINMALIQTDFNTLADAGQAAQYNNPQQPYGSYPPSGDA